MYLESHWIANRKVVQLLMGGLAIFFLAVANLFPWSLKSLEGHFFISIDSLLLQGLFLIAGTGLLCLFELDTINSMYPRVARLLNAKAKQRASQTFNNAYWECVRLSLLAGLLQVISMGYSFFLKDQSAIGTLCALLFAISTFGLFGAHICKKVRLLGKLEERLLDYRLQKEELQRFKEELTGTALN